MNTQAMIGEALPNCFPLPRTIEIGDQTWIVAVSAILMRTEKAVSVRLLLSGPHERHRRVRLDVETVPLLAGEYDVAPLVAGIAGWLPNSDAEDMLELSGRDLMREAEPAAAAQQR